MYVIGRCGLHLVHFTVPDKIGSAGEEKEMLCCFKCWTPPRVWDVKTWTPPAPCVVKSTVMYQCLVGWFLLFLLFSDSLLFYAVPTAPACARLMCLSLNNKDDIWSTICSNIFVWCLYVFCFVSRLIRIQRLNVLPLKPGVLQQIGIHATLTAKDFFLISTFPVHSPAFFPKPLPISPVLAVANTWFLCRPAE